MTTAREPKAEPAILDVATPAEWEAWLDDHHADVPEGVWLRLLNKAAIAEGGLTYGDAVDVALCFGWIDGQGRKHDDASRLQRFTPRRPRGVWSRINTERVTRLTAEARMRPAGLRQVELAKADGRWAQAYDPPSTATIPDDFMAELAKHPKAAAFFATLNKRNTYPVAYRLQTAKTLATRAKRMQAMIEMFERGEKFYD